MAVIVADVVLLSSSPEVSQSRATLAGSAVVVVEVVVVWCGPVELVLDFDVEDAPLGSELVELGMEVSQSRAALMGLGVPVDELTLVLVDDEDVVDIVLFLFP